MWNIECTNDYRHRQLDSHRIRKITRRCRCCFDGVVEQARHIHVSSDAFCPKQSVTLCLKYCDDCWRGDCWALSVKGFWYPASVHFVTYFQYSLQARVYYSDSVIRNPTLLPRRPLEPSQFSVRMSNTQCNSPADRSYMVTTNHVNSVGN